MTTIAYQNVQSLRDKLGELQQFTSTIRPQVLCLIETMLPPNRQPPSLRGYSVVANVPFTADAKHPSSPTPRRPPRARSGSIVYCTNNIVAVHRPDLGVCFGD